MLLWTKWLSFDCMSQYSQLLELVLLETMCARCVRPPTKPQDKKQIFAAKFCCMLDPYSIILKLTYISSDEVRTQDIKRIILT